MGQTKQMTSAIFEKPLFGASIKVIIYNMDEGIAKGVFEKMYKEALRLQKIFNFFDPQSELSSLNRRRKMQVSPELLEVIKRSLKMSEMTSGKYDVSLGRRIIQRKKGLEEEEPDCSYMDIVIKGNSVSLENPDAMIDLGSIAKGCMTDRLGDLLKKEGVEEFLIDSRGDLLFSGGFIHIIGVQHPREKGRNFCQVKISDCGVATSGDYRQYKGSFDKSHILNSRDIISVTVIARTVEEADMLTTAIFVADNRQIGNIMKKHKDSSALVIRKNMASEQYNDFRRFII